jgi:hypothetical protein
MALALFMLPLAGNVYMLVICCITAHFLWMAVAARTESVDGMDRVPAD